MDSHPLLDGMVRVLSERDGDLEEQARGALLFVAVVLDDATRHEEMPKDIPPVLIEVQRAIADHLFQASLAPRE